MKARSQIALLIASDMKMRSQFSLLEEVRSQFLEIFALNVRTNDYLPLWGAGSRNGFFKDFESLFGNDAVDTLNDVYDL